MQTNPATSDAAPVSTEGLRAVVLDTETTGFSVDKGHRVVEVAAVDIIGGMVMDASAWSSLVDPGREVPEEATRIHGITTEQAHAAPVPVHLAANLRQRIGANVLVFHNAPFDLPFLAQFFEEGCAQGLVGLDVIDTLGLARILRGMSRNKLTDLAADFKLPIDQAHRATSDAITTGHLLLHLLPAFRARGVTTVKALAEASMESMRKTAFTRR